MNFYTPRPKAQVDLFAMIFFARDQFVPFSMQFSIFFMFHEIHYYNNDCIACMPDIILDCRQIVKKKANSSRTALEQSISRPRCGDV